MQSKPYHYYIGPWVWRTKNATDKRPDCWTSPEGTVGLVDLRSLPQMSISGGTPEGYGFFAVDGVLPSPYVEIGSGYVSSSNVLESTKDYIGVLIGYRPSGMTVLDVIWDILTIGSDPTGVSGVGPLIPSSSLDLELHLGGHSLVKTEKFVYGVHPHTEKVKAVLQKDYRKCRAFDKASGKKNYLKILDMWGEKYKLANPEDEFIPSDLPKEKPEKHSTTITESFTKGDGVGLGNDLSWSTTNGTFITSGNVAYVQDTYSSTDARAESDLSGSDMYAQIYLLGNGSGDFAQTGPIVRFSSSARTYYACLFGNDNKARLYKCVAGSYTEITTAVSVTVSVNETYKINASGSTITGYKGGASQISTTDSSISGNTRAGVYGYGYPNYGEAFDNFEAADIAAGGGGPATGFMTCNSKFWG